MRLFDRKKLRLSGRKSETDKKVQYYDNPYSQQSGGYGQSAYGQAAPASYDSRQYGSPYSQGPQQSDMEMSSIPQNGGYQATSAQQQDPNYMINECRNIMDEINNLKAKLETLQTAQTRSLSDPNNNAAKSQLESLNATVTTEYKSLMNRLKFLKSRPDSGRPINSKQIGLAERTLKDAWQSFQSLEADYRRKIREQIERQYRITRPDATDEEVRQATDDPNVQIFSQALMSSNRCVSATVCLSGCQ